MSAYGYCYNNPVKFVDPDGNAPVDHIFDRNGRFIRDTGKGSNIIIQIDGKNLSPSQLDPKSKAHNQAMSNVAAYYRTQMGIDPKKFKVGTAGNPEGMKSDINPAFTDLKNIIRINSRGSFNACLDNYNNLENTIKHENLHQKDNITPGFSSNLSTHADVYLRQMGDKSFADTTDDYKMSTARSFSIYLLNMDRDDTGQYSMINILDKIEMFNNLNTGILLEGPKAMYQDGKLNLTLWKDGKREKVEYSKVKH